MIGVGLQLALGASLLGGCPGSLESREEFENLLAAQVTDGTGDGGVTSGKTGGSGGSGASSGGSGGGGGIDPACGDVVKDIIKKSCVAAGCHQAEASAAGLDLETGGILARLEDAEASATCDGELLIDSMQPEQSLLYAKLGSAPPCGLRMPLGGSLDDDKQACILEWIEAGLDADGQSGSSSGSRMDASMPPSSGSKGQDAAAGEMSDGGVGPAKGTELDASGWTATASKNGGEGGGAPGNAIDGDPATRFSTGAPMEGGETLTIDFGEPLTFSRIVMDSSGSMDDYARGYEVFATDDPSMRGMAVAQGSGSGAVVTVNFDDQTARYLIIEQTGSHDTNYWSIHELTVVR